MIGSKRSISFSFFFLPFFSLSLFLSLSLSLSPDVTDPHSLAIGGPLVLVILTGGSVTPSVYLSNPTHTPPL